MRYFDIHAHINFPDYDADRDTLIEEHLRDGIGMMNIGTNLETSREVVALAHKYDNLYAAVALHPVDAGKESFDYDVFVSLASDEKVKAIGECGLDYFRGSVEDIQKQKEVFIQHIMLANTLGKPLMLHIRNAYADALEILKEHAKVKGNVHFFAGTIAEAQAFIDLGFTVSFTGVITFTHDYDAVIRHVPLDMLLAETDCPFVAPVPFRGKRNEPRYVVEVVKKIAEIKGLDEETVRIQMLENARRVFGV